MIRGIKRVILLRKWVMRKEVAVGVLFFGRIPFILKPNGV